ncbi:hypothetical protein [Vibrio phage VP4B]|uniref:Uncharacterized protein n=1 Tax=Vibrio phage VP4B TaxID=1262540 RepID=V9LZW7_9CAUD|nr:virion structural protein [Vibrio phage VP4B]AGB07230.1 hypothetical protein [Vibrio phage VP4B]
MSDFRKVIYGYADSRLMDPTLTAMNSILRAYVKSAQDMAMRIDPASIQEVLDLANKFVGGDFKHWMMANYDHGLGPRARLIRMIAKYLDGGISDRTLSQTITADEQYVTTTDLKYVKGAYRGAVDHRDYDDIERVIDNLKEDDLYRLVEGIGPQLFARMLITFNGESAYGRV